MFQEQLAQLTADHLRAHYKAYLDHIQSQFTGREILSLKVPGITSATLVGGVMQVPHDKLPAVGVDCMGKADIPSGESLNYYQYDGAIAGLVSARNADEVDRACKRHAGAVELFVREHQYLHEISDPRFSVREFLYARTQFSGAMEIELDESKALWVAGFTCETFWITSEDTYRQHIDV